MLIKNKWVTWFLVGLISIPLGFLLSLYGYGYGFPTPGTYFSLKLIPPSAHPEGLGRLGDAFFLGTGIDSSCCYALIWIVYTSTLLVRVKDVVLRLHHRMARVSAV